MKGTTLPDEARPLPEGWRWVQLGKLANSADCFADGPFGSKLKTEHYSRQGARVVRLQNIGRGTFLDGDKAYIPMEHFQSLRRHSVLPGDVVVAALGDGARPAGRACQIPDEFGPGLVKADCFRVRLPDSSILPSYLVAYLNSPESLSCVAGLMRGATRPRVTLDILRKVPVPLTPLREQKRVADLLTKKLEVMERAKRAAEEQANAARFLDARYLREIFGGEMCSGWPVQRLGDVGEIAAGITLGRRLAGEATRKVPYLRVANVKDGHLDLSDVYQIEATDGEISRLRLRRGDLLLTEGGDPDKLGRGTFWQEELPECLHQNHIFRVRFDPARYLPEFVSAQIGSPYGKAYFLAHAKQTTGIATINQGVLKAFPLISPTVSVQRGIVKDLARKRAASSSLCRTLEGQLAAVSALPAALLRQAFRGEL